MKNLLFTLAAKAFDSSILDYKFFAILIVLAVSVVTVCCLYARSEKFKLKNNKQVIDESYKAPTIVRVQEKKD